MVRVDPFYQPSEAEASPRVRSTFAEVRQRLQDIGYGPIDGTTPAEVAAREARMTAHWAPIVKATGFKGD